MISTWAQLTSTKHSHLTRTEHTQDWSRTKHTQEMDDAEHMAHFDLEMTYRKRAHLRMSYAFHEPSLIRTPAGK